MYARTKVSEMMSEQQSVNDTKLLKKASEKAQNMHFQDWADFCEMALQAESEAVRKGLHDIGVYYYRVEEYTLTY